MIQVTRHSLFIDAIYPLSALDPFTTYTVVIRRKKRSALGVVTDHAGLWLRRVHLEITFAINDGVAALAAKEGAESSTNGVNVGDHSVII